MRCLYFSDKMNTLVDDVCYYVERVNLKGGIIMARMSEIRQYAIKCLQRQKVPVDEDTAKKISRGVLSHVRRHARSMFGYEIGLTFSEDEGRQWIEKAQIDNWAYVKVKDLWFDRVDDERRRKENNNILFPRGLLTAAAHYQQPHFFIDCIEWLQHRFIDGGRFEIVGNWGQVVREIMSYHQYREKINHRKLRRLMMRLGGEMSDVFRVEEFRGGGKGFRERGEMRIRFTQKMVLGDYKTDDDVFDYMTFNEARYHMLEDPTTKVERHYKWDGESRTYQLVKTVKVKAKH